MYKETEFRIVFDLTYVKLLPCSGCSSDASNPSIWEVKAGGTLEVQGQPDLCSEF